MNYNKADFYASYGKYSQVPKCDRIEIAFAGRSNVGKSTLINRLFNRKALARVSSVPGKTATINFYTCDDIYFVDLPGYGYAKVSKDDKLRWSGLIEGYLNDEERDIRMVVLLIDMRHKPSEDDLHMIDYLVEKELPFVIVFTKADKLNKTQRLEREKGFEKEIPYYDEICKIPFSSQTREGLDELKKVVEDIASEKTEEE